MSQTNQIQLKISSILNVPLQIYDSDFSFIVNGKEFKTSRLISELISPNICKIHLSDPTIDSITINTNEQGDFSHFLQLATFNKIDIQPNELEFIKEIVDILGSENLIITEELDPTEITLDNIFPLVKKHEFFLNFPQNNLKKKSTLSHLISMKYVNQKKTNWSLLKRVRYFKSLLIRISNSKTKTNF
ncbi:hypothetical protein M9Y10_018541 [Tritrichomonas musculus]|uniref:BTB domain-containing protein n=1 Tax=Tritrichomonas musculus TaxID=1915356 RepID=A0ABR2HNR5_9EUKA